MKTKLPILSYNAAYADRQQKSINGKSQFEIVSFRFFFLFKPCSEQPNQYCVNLSVRYPII